MFFGNFGCSLGFGGFTGARCGCSNYSSFGGNPFYGYNAGPSFVNVNFNRPSMFMGGGLGYGCNPYFGGPMAPIMGYNKTVDKIFTGAYGAAQVVEGIDNLRYALG